MGILHDDEEDLRSELAELKAKVKNACDALCIAAAEVQDLKQERDDFKNLAQTSEDFHAEVRNLLQEAGVPECDFIDDQVALLIAERDRYLTRACVAEAKVVKVRELARYHLDAPATMTMFRKVGEQILAAIGGDK